MFTSPAPAATTTAAPSAPSSRTHRLRGLNYLRNYTSHHLHSHSNNQGQESGNAAGNPRSQLSGERSLQLDVPGARINEADSEIRPRNHNDELSLPIFSSFTGSPSSNPDPRPNWLFNAGEDASAQSDGQQQRTEPTQARSSSQPSAMTRNRDSTGPSPTARNSSGGTVLERAGISGAESGASAKPQLPSIRFIPHQDPRAARPSLNFSTITRTLPNESAIIRVGRYSERDNNPEVVGNGPSSAPVGFKSKVVSRRHCEFWYSNSRWWIKDVKSSSGTFLNHIRLSQPGMESPPYEIKDGDVVQLGIDFRGGEEMIFRCVKIRVECNRGWQQSVNSFNKQTHKRLKNLAKSAKKDSDAASSTTSECSICLMSIAPCQSLFVAPCSHVWHYKCIRQLLTDAHYPNFLCPNCRAVADLEADVDEPADFSESDDEVEKAILESKVVINETNEAGGAVTPRATQPPADGSNNRDGVSSESSPRSPAPADEPIDDTIVAAMASASLNDTGSEASPGSSLSPASGNSTGARAGSTPRPIPLPQRSNNSLSPERTSNGITSEGPLTPRNDLGPFILDGSAGRTRRGVERTATNNSNDSS